MTEPRLFGSSVPLRRGVLGLGIGAAGLFVRPVGPQLAGPVVRRHTELPSPGTTWQAHAVTATCAVVLMQQVPRN